MLRAAGAGAGILALARNSIPFIIAPTGTMANNGAITLGTALATTYANAYINLPAGAISAGSLAGWYFCQMSSGTVGTVFNNTYSSGVPTIPASPTAFVTTGPGAYTGVTSAVTGPQITIPAGSISAAGLLRIWTLWATAGTAGSKTIACTLGGSTYQSNTFTTSQASNASVFTFWGRAGGLLIAPANAGFGLNSLTNSPQFLSINVGAAQTFTMVGTMAVATDYVVMEAALIEGFL